MENEKENEKVASSYPVGIGKVDDNYHPLVNLRIKPAKGKYPIIDVPADGKPKWYGGACCMMFVYSKNHGNFILKGFSDEVKKYLKKHYTHYFYYISMWCDGKSRGYWHFWKNCVTIFEPNRRLKRNKRYKYVVHKSFNGGTYNDLSGLKQEKPIELKFKRLPKQWIPEFDQL